MEPAIKTHALRLEQRLQQLAEAPDDSHLKTVHVCLQSLRLSTLHDICQAFPRIDALLRMQALQTFWDAQLKSITVSGLQGYRFQKPSRLHTQDFVLGYFNFFFSHKTKNANIAEVYQKRALKYHSFHQFLALTQSFLSNIDTLGAEQFPQWMTFLSGYEQEAKWHGTPGAMSIAILYMKIADYLFTHKKPLSAKVALDKTLEFLYIAKYQLEDSKEDIHNAHLSLATENPFSQKSLERLFQACHKSAAHLLDMAMLSRAIQAAKAYTSDHIHPTTAEPAKENTEVHAHILTESIPLLRLAYAHTQKEQSAVCLEELLHFAIRHQKIDSVRALLTMGADCGATDAYGNTSLHLAALSNHSGIFRVLLHQNQSLLERNNYLGISTNDILSNNQCTIKTHVDRKHVDACIAAIQNHSLETLIDTLHQQVSPNLHAVNGRTLLAEALTHCRIEQVMHLLAAGVSLTEKDKDGTPIIFHLLKEEAHGNERQQREHLLRYLSDLGLDINAQNAAGQTLLMVAAQNEDVENLRFLLGQDTINTTLVDNHGKTAADYAAEAGGEIAALFSFGRPGMGDWIQSIRLFQPSQPSSNPSAEDRPTP